MGFMFNGLSAEVTISGAVSSEPEDKTIDYYYQNGTGTIYTCPANKKASLIYLQGSTVSTSTLSETGITSAGVRIATIQAFVEVKQLELTWDYKRCPVLLATETLVISGTNSKVCIMIIEESV